MRKSSGNRRLLESFELLRDSVAILLLHPMKLIGKVAERGRFGQRYRPGLQE